MGRTRDIKTGKVCWARHVERVGDKSDLNRSLMTKRERKGTLGRSKLRWEDNIKMGLKET